MKKILFYIFRIFSYFITLLPLRVLYIFSDFLFLLLYYFPSYRREVVSKNLRNAFPEKSEKERKTIERRFYRHMADLFVESVKVTHMGPKQMSRRFRFRDMTLLDRLFDEDRDVLAVCNHYNNWEWLSSMPLYSRFRALTIYKPLKNKYFDRYMFDLRSKYGVEPAPMQNILKVLIKHRKENVKTVSAFIADQAPPKGEHVHWAHFLNQETAFYTGTEKVAVMLNMAVVFVHIIKVRRGYYEVEVTPVSENPKAEEPGAITEKHIHILEEIIREKPEYWLWSHKRWKHKRPVNE
jgi:Kdo2-lipid IVA lauroyltransferase/acyltransferase